MDIGGNIQVLLSRNMLWLCILMVLLPVLIMVVTYTRRLRAVEIGTISSLSAIAVIGRILFFFVPVFSPTSGLIIIAGSVYGPAVGCLIGSTTALLSNIVFGQGTWTPFQMFCWGVIGFFSGFIKKKSIAIIYSVVAVMLFYGVTMNMFTMLVSTGNYTWMKAWLFELHGIPVDLAHTISTVLVLIFLWKPMRKKLVRIRDKYGVLTKEGIYRR